MVFRIGCKFFKKKTKKRHSEQILTSIISAVNNKPPKDEIEKFKKFKNKYIMMAKGDSGFAKTANAASGNGTNGDQDGMPIVLASGSFNPTSSAAGMQHNSFHPPPYGGQQQQQQHYGQGTQGDSNFAAGNVFLNTNNASNNNNNKDNNYN